MHCVYRIFSEAGSPLYVGTTSRQWWVRVAEQATTHDEIANTASRVDVTYHATRESAFEVEQAEIKRLAPRINIRSLWHENRQYSPGELTDVVLGVIQAKGETTSADVIASIPDVSPSSVRTVMMRLRQSGQVETVRMETKYGAGVGGRPMHVVRVA